MSATVPLHFTKIDNKALYGNHLILDILLISIRKSHGKCYYPTASTYVHMQYSTLEYSSSSIMMKISDSSLSFHPHIGEVLNSSFRSTLQ